MTTHEKAQIAAELFADEETGMVWQPVESSQIAEIGYDASTNILGIKFPTGKRSAASEYHYANVTPEMHREFMEAESIGSYFGQNIKSRPDLYPYTKIGHIIEHTFNGGAKKLNTENPPKPSAGVAPSTQAVQGDTNGDLPSPSTALAVIDTLAPEVIFAPGNVDSILVKLREQVLAMAKGLDPSTPAKQKRIRDVKGLVASQRIFVEKARKGYVADLVAKKGLTDSVSKVIQGRLSDIESEILEVTGYAAWEQGEKEFESRMTGLQNRLAGMGKEMHLYTSCAAIEAAIKELEEFDTSDTREHKQGIETAVDNSLRVLKPELERRKEMEAQAAELAKLRAEAAERAEQDRQATLAKIAQQQAEQATAARVAAIAAAVETERREALAREEAADRRVKEMEDERIETLALAEHDREAAVEAERKRVADAAKREQEAAEARAADEKHRNKVNYEAAYALASECLIDEPAAHEVIKAIAKGLIPHITIQY